MVVNWNNGKDLLPKAGEEVLIRVAETYAVGFYDEHRRKFIFNKGGAISPEKVEWKSLVPLKEAK